MSVLGLFMEEKVQIAPKLVTIHTVAEDYREKAQILLVEDYPTNQQVAMKHLQRAGYHVDLAENGQLAVEAYKRKHYDIILMDIQMPVMDGLEATKAIRNLQSAIRIPIIAMTAHAMKADREKAFEAGMDDYITKPLKRTKLLAAVDKWNRTILAFGTRPPASPTGSRWRAGNADYEIKDSNKNKSKIQLAPMNFEKAIEEFEGDKKFLIDVLKGFLDNVRAQIETIRQAISNGDAEVVWKEAHSIISGAENLTADKLSKIAFELEKVGKSGTLEEGGEVLERLKKEFYHLENFARGIDEYN